MVAVDDLGNLKAAAFGPVPSDMLPGQTSRDGEDYAAAMAGQFSMDPITLHIDCEGTIATIQGPRCKALGATHPRAHVWSRLLASHDEVRAVKVKGHATMRDVEAGRSSHLCQRGNDFADFCQERGRRTQATLSDRQDDGRLRLVGHASCALGCRGTRSPQAPGLGRHEGYSSEDKDQAGTGATQEEVQSGGCGPCIRKDRRLAGPTGTLGFFARQFSRPPLLPRAQLAIGACLRRGGQGVGPSHHLLRQVWGLVLGTSRRTMQKLQAASRWVRVSQLRKLRSGLFPNKRYPGWTVAHVRRPTLDEANTLVAQLESCEAGLGRSVLGPTTPKRTRVAPQASELLHWQRDAGTDKTADTDLRRWDAAHDGYLAAYGLNAHLVEKLALKAGSAEPARRDAATAL